MRPKKTRKSKDELKNFAVMKMEQDAVREKIISDQDFPVIARRTLINGPQLIFGGHWHSQFELLYIKRGTLELCCNNVDYVLHSGDIAVLNPYDIHTAYSGNGILFYYCIIIDPEFLSSGKGDVCTRKYVRPFVKGDFRFANCISETPQRETAFEAIVSECRRKETGFELAVKSELLRVFVDLYRTVPVFTTDKDEWEARQKRAQRFQAVFTYIEQHYGENLTLEQLASTANYSPYHFNRQFRSITGRTPMEYLRNLRMQKAVQMLRDGASVSATALNCGFNSPNYFCKVFHEEFGYPPKAYHVKSPT